jgi:hypothetical protein
VSRAHLLVPSKTPDPFNSSVEKRGCGDFVRVVAIRESLTHTWRVLFWFYTFIKCFHGDRGAEQASDDFRDLGGGRGGEAYLKSFLVKSTSAYPPRSFYRFVHSLWCNERRNAHFLLLPYRKICFECVGPPFWLANGAQPISLDLRHFFSSCLPLGLGQKKVKCWWVHNSRMLNRLPPPP